MEVPQVGKIGVHIADCKCCYFGLALAAEEGT